MCGRFTRHYSWDELTAIMQITSAQRDFAASYNVAPTEFSPIVQRDRTIHDAKWGLLPPTETKSHFAPINARAETVATLPIFRSAFKSGRCVVPVSGFYEWEKTGTDAKGKDIKQPWYIARTDAQPILFAAISSAVAYTESESFAIITTAANDFMRPIHHRCPVILEPEQVAAWLDGPDPAALLTPPADGIMARYRVTTRVNKPANKDRNTILPLE